MHRSTAVALACAAMAAWVVPSFAQSDTQNKQSYVWPRGIAADPAGGVYVNAGGQVVHFSGTNTTSDQVSTTPAYMTGLALDSVGGFWAFIGNSVVHYIIGQTTPDITLVMPRTQAFGSQMGFIPSDVAVGADGGLFVSDTAGNRVVHFPAGSTTIDTVYGQHGDVLAVTPGGGPDGLNSPMGLAVDPSGGLYVADMNNNRVLHFSGASTTADRVYGQNDDLTTGARGGCARSLSGPEYVAADPTGGLYISDTKNNRVLHFPPDSSTADRVYGQNSDFVDTNALMHQGKLPLSVAYLASPNGIAADASGGVYIEDSWKGLLYFTAGQTLAAERTYSQPTGNDPRPNTLLCTN